MTPEVREQAFVGLATVLAGARPFKEGNVNDTFRGQVLTHDGDTRAAIIKDLDARQLANELMGAALANAAGLPVPQAYLAMADPARLAASKGPEMAGGSRLLFASTDADTPPVADRQDDVIQDGLAALKEQSGREDITFVPFTNVAAIGDHVLHVEERARA